jgi:putative intracellular protease/amidase
VLITAGILKGRKVTCYKGKHILFVLHESSFHLFREHSHKMFIVAITPDVEMAGATFVQVPNTQAVVDGT